MQEEQQQVHDPKEVQQEQQQIEREQFVMQRLHQVLTLLQEGLQEPFQLYTLEVVTKLMKDVPKLDTAPDISMIDSIPNRGKVYYGEDIQMITLMKKKCLELKEKKYSVAQITDKIADWLEQYADIIIRTQYDQKWCEQQILVCVRLFKERYLKDQDLKLEQSADKPEKEQTQAQETPKQPPKEGEVNITVTFDSLCGCAYVYKKTRNQALKGVIFINLLPMVEVCVAQQEAFLDCIKQSQQLRESLQPKQEAVSDSQVEVEVPVPDCTPSQDTPTDPVQESQLQPEPAEVQQAPPSQDTPTDTVQEPDVQQDVQESATPQKSQAEEASQKNEEEQSVQQDVQDAAEQDTTQLQE